MPNWLRAALLKLVHTLLNASYSVETREKPSTMEVEVRVIATTAMGTFPSPWIAISLHKIASLAPPAA